MLLQYVAVDDSVVRCRSYSFQPVELSDCHECVALFLEFRDEHLESFDSVVVAIEVMQKDYVAVFERVDQNVVSFLCGALRYPVLASYATDECVGYHLMH